MSRRLSVFALGTLVLVAFSATAFAQVGHSYSPVKVVKAARFARSIPLRDMQWQLPPIMQRIIGDQALSEQQMAQLREKLVHSGLLRAAGKSRVIPLLRKAPALSAAPRVRDPALQARLATNRTASNFTTALESFQGLGRPNDRVGCAPPDTNLAAGDNYVVEIVNLCDTGAGEFEVFQKDGTRVLGPVALAGLWSSGGVCSDRDDGDVVVLYDQLANRWVLSQFAGQSQPTDECVAVSVTSDPTGSYYVYDFPVFPNEFADYPKMAVWPDAYYASFNVFNTNGNSFEGAGFVAFDRSEMLAGNPSAQMVVFQGNGSDLAYSVLPATVDGYTPPPAGAPGIFVDYTSPWLWRHRWALQMWQMHVNWVNPDSSTLTGPTQINVDPSNDGICNGARACIPQPDGGESLDSLGDRLMFRLAYRNFGDHQALVTNQTVGTGAAPSGPPSGIRWYELDAPAGATGATAWSVAQQGTYLPDDGSSRWMGSIAMDAMGNMALGFSLSSASINPSVVYTGRLATDPAGQMTQAETTLVTGDGVQEATGHRWGDYSSMVTDPSDDCTLWYAQEYYPATGRFAWSTWIGAFKFGDCGNVTGVLEGTVTDAAGGQPIKGATVSLGNGVSFTTDDQGHYAITDVPGDYTATARAWSYAAGTAAVSVNAGQTTTQNFALQTAPTVTLSGTVSDGSGHGWPLYAEVKVSTPGFGQVADLWTDPKSGDYSVGLPEGYDYTISAQAFTDGYHRDSATVALNGDTVQNFALTVAPTCAAPGYGFVEGLGEDFNNGVPPAGWSVTNDVTGSTVIWAGNFYWFTGNFTGGTGQAATADSDAAGIRGYYGHFDTSLITPPLAVTSLPADPILKFKLNYQNYQQDALDIDINANGTGWTNLAHLTSNYGRIFSTADIVTYQIDLGPHMPASGSIKLRWRYYNLLSGYDWYAQIDDVVIGGCQPTSGGLVEGAVSDANTGQGIVGATVADDTGASTKTGENSADANLPQGYYFLFSPTGDRTLTASASLYTDAGATVSVADNSVNAQNFTLKAGRLSAAPTPVAMSVMVNTQAQKTLTVHDTGGAPAHFRIYSVNAPPPSTATGAPLHNIHCANLSPLSLSQPSPQSPDCAGSGGSDGSTTDNSAAWTAIADYPTPIMDNCAATADDGTGQIYSVGAQDQFNVSMYKYDPRSNTYTQLAGPPSPTALERPACAFINGKFYVSNGWVSGGGISSALYIYDPITDTWSEGADNPAPGVAGGATAVTLDGKMYVIGGCTNGGCGFRTVEVYDPVTNTWSSAADYPFPVSWTGCGAIGGKIYCAGGSGGSSPSGASSDTYVYDPATDSWSGPLAPVPVPNGYWGMGYAATASGQLLLQDGVADNAITNEGFIYDVASNSWSRLPNSTVSAYRMGSACGFYEFGGNISGSSPVPVVNSETLPGYPCGSQKIPWLTTLTPMSGTLAGGASADVQLTFDGTGQKKFTTSRAYLLMSGNTPYGPQIVPLTVTWTPQPIHLVLSGAAAPSPIHKGNTLTYSLTVENQQMDNHGSASETQMSYALPAGVSYVASSGDASCTAPSGSASAPAAASAQPGTVSCDFGTIDLGASKSEAIAVRVADAGTLTSTFDVSAREPDSDPSTNTLSIATTVIGTADLSASASDVTIAPGSTGTVKMAVKNNGPDTATDVAFKVSAGANAKLLSASSSVGSCALISGQNALSCDIGDVATGQTVNIDVSAFGAYAGTASVQGQVTTSANDSDQTNNVTTATVTVTASSSGSGGGSGGGGGGALGWLALAALLGLVFAGAWARSRRA